MSSKDKKPVEDRNFRSHYYEKVGFRGVDERKTVDALLKEDPLSQEKCAAFALKYGVPSDTRVILWKVILGVTALYPANRDHVEKWREKPYHDTKRALQFMNKVSDEKPKAQNITVTYLLFTKQLRFDLEKQLQEWPSQNFMAIAESVSSICPSEVDTFWISKHFSDFLNKQSKETMKELVEMWHTKIQKSKLYSHMDKIGLIQDLPLLSWFHRGFAGVLHPSALERLWDKVFGGSLVLMVYVATALVETTKVAVMGCQTAKEAIRCLTSTSEETDEMIAQKAIDHWMQEGSLLLPTERKQHRPLSATTSNKITQETMQNASEIIKSE